MGNIDGEKPEPCKKQEIAKNKNQETISVPNFALNDLIEDILTELPVKSLLRFKCVCKHWDALTEDPRFVSNHLNFGGGCKGAVIPSYDDNNANFATKNVYALHHGLSIVCGDSFHILNRATRKVLDIPNPPLRKASIVIMCYDCDTNLYTLVIISCDAGGFTGNGLCAQTLTLRGGELCWKVINVPELHDFNEVGQTIRMSTSLDGAFHSVRFRKGGVLNNIEVVSVNFKNGCVSRNTLPESFVVIDPEKLGTFFWGYKLSFFYLVNEKQMNVVVLENYENHAFSEKKIDITTIKEDTDVEPADTATKGKVVIPLGDGKLIIYDVKTGKLKRVSVEAYRMNQSPQQSLVYIEGMRPAADYT